MTPTKSKAAAAQTVRAGIYDRVSDDRTGKGRSVDEQNEANRAACAEQGWTVTLTAADNSISASRFANGKARPGWEKIVAAVEAGKIDVLVLWESSRGSRDPVVWMTLLATCRAHGVLIHVTSHHTTYDPRIARQWRTLAEDAVDSAYEADKSSDRICRAMRSNAIKGRPHGKVPYGYERIYDPVTREFVEQRPDPETAPIVREIVTKMGKGVPIIAITRDLNARQIPSPTGKTWLPPVVREIGRSPRYIAKREFDGELLDGDWPALVTEAEHYAVVRLLSDPSRTTTRPGRAKYLLSCFATCAGCGAGLAGIEKPGREPYYRCGSLSGKSCTAMRMDWLDDYVTAYVCKRLSRADAAEVLVVDDDADVVAARAEVEALEGELDGWRRSALAGETSKATLAFMEAEFTVKIAAARRRATVPKAVHPAVRELLGLDGGGNGGNSYEEVLARFEAMDVGRRKAALRSLVTVSLGRAEVHGPNRKPDHSRVTVLGVEAA